MKFEKKIVDEIFKCYSVNALQIDGETRLIYAAEGPGSCQIYKGENFDEKEVLWDNDVAVGGTMSIVTVEDKEGYFFISKGFHSMVDSSESVICLNRYKEGSFEEIEIAKIPYLHRFDVMTIGDKRYLVAAALHDGKVDKEDWSRPGKLYVAEVPYELDVDFKVELKVLKDNMTKNHGFNKGMYNGKLACYVASEEGVIAVMPPQEDKKEWVIETVVSHPVSDVAAIDMDGDGELELALLSPFHGNQFDVYKKVDGEYKSVYKYEKELDFYHAIFADTFEGKPSFVIGARKEDMDLYLVQYDENKKAFVSYLIDTQVGAANARIIHTEKGDMIMVANRQIGEAAFYTLAK